MPSIEFVEDEPAGSDHPVPTGAEQPAPAQPTGPGRAGVASAALLVLAAGVLVTASFTDIYRLRYVSSTDGSVQAETVDGWGRVRFAVRSGIEGQHTTRFGIALCAVAATLVLVALAAVLPRVAGPWVGRARRWSPGAALVALGLGAGVLASAALELQAQRDNSDTFSDGDIRLEQSIGPFFWLGGSALLVGALALAVPAVGRLGAWLTTRRT